MERLSFTHEIFTENLASICQKLVLALRLQWWTNEQWLTLNLSNHVFDVNSRGPLPSPASVTANLLQSTMNTVHPLEFNTICKCTWETPGIQYGSGDLHSFLVSCINAVGGRYSCLITGHSPKTHKIVSVSQTLLAELEFSLGSWGDLEKGCYGNSAV